MHAGGAGGPSHGLLRRRWELFSSVAKVTGVAGVVLLLFSPLLRRLMGGEEEIPVLREVPVSPEVPGRKKAVP